jgi:hypothetical protein
MTAAPGWRSATERETVEPRPWRCRGRGRTVMPSPVHLLVDSTGLRLCGPGEWLIEKHGTRRRRAWRKMHIGVDADTGRIVASELTGRDSDDGPGRPLARQVEAPLASFTSDGAYDRDDCLPWSIKLDCPDDWTAVITADALSGSRVVQLPGVRCGEMKKTNCIQRSWPSSLPSNFVTTGNVHR